MALRSLNRDFVNKGGASEMFAGLEMVKYSDCFQKAEMHYWQNTAKGSNAEAENAMRHVEVVPLYALSNLRHTPEDYRNMISKETMEAEKR